MLKIGETTEDVREAIGVDALPVSAAVTGQIVVETAIVCVIKTVESAGQFVMVGAHEVIVTFDVVKIIEVLYETIDSEAAEEVAGLTSVEDAEILGTLYEEGVVEELLYDGAVPI